jgi:hypothetical protein
MLLVRITCLAIFAASVPASATPDPTSIPPDIGRFQIEPPLEMSRMISVRLHKASREGASLNRVQDDAPALQKKPQD